MSADTNKANGRDRARARARQPEPQEMTEEERIEHELAEEARRNSGSWDSVAPGKAQDFGASFRRMLGLLAPWKWSFTFASILGAIGVVLTVIAPKVLAEATNLIFEGVISKTEPPSPRMKTVPSSFTGGRALDWALRQ